MSAVLLLHPERRVISVDELSRALSLLTVQQPFSQEAIAFCDALSRSLIHHPVARRLPAFQSLAFWIRRSEVTRMSTRGRGIAHLHERLAPRGVVFHIPPANVDTMFLYSWLLAVLAGNANVVRISSRVADAHGWLWDLLRELLDDPRHYRIAEGTLFLSFGRDAAVSTLCSMAADVRVIWGGDETVRTIREIPIPPHCQELVFPDRRSMSVIRTSALAALSHQERARVAEKFYNDAYWFDQLGCSSPRLVAWIGETQASVVESFWQLLADECARRGYSPDGTDVVAKVTAAGRAALDTHVASVTRYGAAVHVVALTETDFIPSHFPGAGYFYSMHLTRLADLAALVRRQDQTVASFGVSSDEWNAVLQSINGRGIDRVVPVGDALAFEPTWDGTDLLNALTRRITVRLDGFGTM